MSRSNQILQVTAPHRSLGVGAVVPEPSTVDGDRQANAQRLFPCSNATMPIPPGACLFHSEPLPQLLHAAKNKLQGIPLGDRCVAMLCQIPDILPIPIRQRGE